MSWACTRTLVVCPVTTAGAELAEGPAAAASPAALGSTPTPTETAMASRVAPMTSCALERASASTGPRSAGCEGAVGVPSRATRATRTALSSNGMNAARASRTSPLQSASAAGGSGARASSNPPLTTTRRSTASVSRRACAARIATAPPSTVGTRYASAPKRIWAATPTTNAATQPSGFSASCGHGVRATWAASASTDPNSHSTAAPTDHGANWRGGLVRAGATRARPHQASDAAYPTRPATASRVLPSSAAVSTSRIVRARPGRAWPASRSARGSMRVRRIVGQNVTRVPVMVRPIQPRIIRLTWASSSRPLASSSRPRARAAPSAAPTGMRAAAVQ